MPGLHQLARPRQHLDHPARDGSVDAHELLFVELDFARGLEDGGPDAGGGLHQGDGTDGGAGSGAGGSDLGGGGIAASRGDHAEQGREQERDEGAHG